MVKTSGRLLGFVLGLLGAVAWAGDTAVLFNELHYQPAGGADTIEWLELHNPNAVDMDLSGWQLTNGVQFVFPAGTVLKGGTYTVVAADPAALQAARGLTEVLGPFTGKLANEGERIELRNLNGRLMDTIKYDSTAPWPLAPAGSGVTLAKRSPTLDSADPASWTSSLRVGGTPGAANALEPGTGPSAPKFSELAATPSAPFWIELTNPDTQDLALAGWKLRRTGQGGGEYAWPEGTTMAPGGFATLDLRSLGWNPKSGERLFLVSPEGDRVVDAARIEARAQARRPGDDTWYVPSQESWGRSNVFQWHDEIVINEIQYHPRPLPPQPAVLQEHPLIDLETQWRFDSTGVDRGTEWNQLGFDDAAWPLGRSAFFVEDAALPVVKATPLTIGPTTFYFRTTFEFSGNPEGARLDLHLLVDDGAAVYLNGVEIARTNLPSGTLSASTLASVGVSDASWGPGMEVPIPTLQKGRNVLAVEVHQAAVTSSDVAFALTASLREQVQPELPLRESPEAWVELYNRGSRVMDLTGWSLDGGIRFSFPPGTTLASGAYLVVAGDAKFLSGLYPGLRVLGDFQGRLSHHGDRLVLRDELGNPANEVAYSDASPWPVTPDGAGSSLELRDPRSDNRTAAAWAASEESKQAVWKTYSYEGTAQSDGGPTRWNELDLGLLDAGEMLLDEVSVIESPQTGAGKELIVNGSFEAGESGWRRLGNHRGSSVIPDPEQPSNHVLELVASGPTEHMHNHIETTLAGNAAIVDGRRYRISFRAKWLSGSPRFNSRLYFSRLAQTTVLDVPVHGGTPGAINSRFEANLGPTLAHLHHEPSVPPVNQPVSVTVEAQDPDGVSECRLWWNVSGLGWQSAPMTLEKGERFQGSIPGQAAATVVQFYVAGTDTRGALATAPARGPDSRALYQVQDQQAGTTRLHPLRIIMTAADSRFQFAATNLMSNESLGATIVSDESEVFYDAGIHLQSSERGRPDESRVGFTIEFPSDHLFRGIHNSISLDRSGGYSGRGGRQDEIVLRQLMNQAGGLPEIYADLVRVIYPRSLEGRKAGVAQLLTAKYGSEFLDDSFAQGSDGGLFKLELIYFPTTSVGNQPDQPKLPQPDDVIGTDFQDRGASAEAYRWYFLIDNHRDLDDYSPLIRLAKTLGKSGTTFDTETRRLMDVDQWARVFAMKSLAGDADTYGFGYPHNLFVYFRPSDGRALAFPWDQDFSWTRGATDPLLPGAQIGRVLSLPANQRLFYGHVEDLLNRTYNGDYAARWTAHFGQLAGQSYSGVLSYIRARSASARKQLPAPVPLRITTSDGLDFLTAARSVVLSGEAGISLRELRIMGAESVGPWVWTSLTRWQTTVSLRLGVNALEVVGYNFSGSPVESAKINVTTSARDGGVDTDGDGIPDSWESDFGLDPNVADSATDRDGDGLTNLQEYWASTRPNDPQSRLAVRLEAGPQGGWIARFHAEPGRAYVLERSTSRVDSNWSPVESIPATAAGLDWTSAPLDLEGASAAFYRISLP